MPGLAAAKHAEHEQRRRELTEAWQLRRSLMRDARGRANGKADENRVPGIPAKRVRPMSRWELYHWHRQNGTMELFFAMFGPKG